jgi:hypothetical protein
MIAIFCHWMVVAALTCQVAGAPAAAGGQNTKSDAAPPAATALAIVDENGARHELKPADFAALPRQSAKATLHGKEGEFSGASLVDLLKSCGVEFGDKLKGRNAATVAVLDATDGYRIIVPLVDIDPATTDRIAIVADQRDGQPLDAKEGPYRLILPGDKREIRSIRNLVAIHIVNLRDLPLTPAPSSEEHRDPH